MARIKRLMFAVLISLALCGCTCALAGCSDRQAVAETAVATARFSMDFVENVDGARNVTVSVLTDMETGKQWLYVRDTTFGKTSIDIEPMDGGQDGAVSD